MGTPSISSTPSTPPTWQSVHRDLFLRYQGKIRTHIHAIEDKAGRDLAQRVLRMCDHMLEHVDEFEEDKSSRWMGFVQGVLTVAGVLNVDIERDHTRPLFHALKGPSPKQSV